jgi:hypothetical protein
MGSIFRFAFCVTVRYYTSRISDRLSTLEKLAERPSSSALDFWSSAMMIGRRGSHRPDQPADAHPHRSPIIPDQCGVPEPGRYRGWVGAPPCRIVLLPATTLPGRFAGTQEGWSRDGDRSGSSVPRPTGSRHRCSGAAGGLWKPCSSAWLPHRLFPLGPPLCALRGTRTSALI